MFDFLSNYISLFKPFFLTAFDSIYRWSSGLTEDTNNRFRVGRMKRSNPVGTDTGKKPQKIKKKIGMLY